MKRPKFSIRALLVMAMFVATACALVIQNIRYQDLARRHELVAAQYSALVELLNENAITSWEGRRFLSE